MTFRWVERITSVLSTRPVRGQIDRFDDGGLSGWAFTPKDPACRIVVGAEIEQDVFHPIVADRYRADVQRAGLGHDGYCGFHLPRSRIRWSGPVRVFAGPGRHPLHWAGRDSRSKTRATSVGDTTRRGEHLFRLAPGSGGRLEGWVVDARNPGRRCELRLETDRDGGATTRACLYRPPPDPAFLDDYHGFSIELPRAARAFRLFDTQAGTVLHEQRLRGRDASRARR